MFALLLLIHIFIKIILIYSIFNKTFYTRKYKIGGSDLKSNTQLIRVTERENRKILSQRKLSKKSYKNIPQEIKDVNF